MKQRRNSEESKGRSPSEILEKKLARERRKSPTDVLERKIAKSTRKRDWKMLLRDLLITMGTVYLLFGVIFGISFVKGDSMEPNLRSGDLVLFLRIGKNYQAGDVVIMHNTATNDYIKRVMAVEGDRVSIDDGNGRLMVNGEKITEDNIYSETYTRTGGVKFPLTVNPDSVFLLGDNREISKDSREFGIVRKEQIAGKVLFVNRRQSKL